MNKGTLPILSRLQALQTAARVAPGGARVIAAISDGNPLAAVLCEVNETVLGRTLTFESSGGSSLTLEVSGRRVLRVMAANGLPEPESCLAAEALEDEHKDNLIKLLQAVAAPRHELRVWAMPMTREVDGVSVGLPVALLADLLLIDLNPLDGDVRSEAAPKAKARPPAARAVPVQEAPMPEPEPEPELEPEIEADPDPVSPVVSDRLPADPEPGGPFLGSFARAIGPDLMAWLIVGGEEDGASDGVEEMVSHLQGFLGDERTALDQQLDQISAEADGPVCIVLGAALIEGHSILCARLGSGILLGVIDGDATLTVLRGWARAAQA